MANVNVNETIESKVNIENKGKSDIENANVTVEIFSFGETDFDKRIVSLSSKSKPIASREEVRFTLLQNATNWKPGEYKAKATVYYDENVTIIDRYFNVGSLNVLITNYTREVMEGQINKFDIHIESKWNNKIDRLYGEVIVNGTTFRTPGVELYPFSKEILTGYWDTTNVLPGTYDALVRVYYQGQTKTEQAIIFFWLFKILSTK